MPVILEYYPLLKQAHVVAVVGSASLFVLRGLAVQGAAAWPMAAPVRYLSYGVDVTLLTAALMLLAGCRAEPRTTIHDLAAEASVAVKSPLTMPPITRTRRPIVGRTRNEARPSSGSVGRGWRAPSPCRPAMVTATTIRASPNSSAGTTRFSITSGEGRSRSRAASGGAWPRKKLSPLPRPTRSNR